LKAFLLALALLLFLSGASAQVYDIASHSIDIRVDGEGYGEVVERFYLTFPSELQEQQFKRKNDELQTDLDEWEKFDGRFRLHIGTKDEIVPGTGRITFNLEEKFLEIKYSLSTPVMSRNTAESTGRMIVFELNRGTLKEFLQGEIYVIPQNTTISFTLPAQATVEREDVFDAAQIFPEMNPVIRIPGGISTNTIKLKYRYWTQLAPSFSLAYLLKEFLENTTQETQTLALAIVLIVFGAVYWKRKALRDRAEAFIVKHSKIS